MTPQEIIERNQLLAEFMGYVNTTPTDPDFNIYENSSGEMLEAMSMQFHTSWDWLMPVVKKCSESFEHHQYDSEEYYHITEEIFHPDYSLSEFMDADIEAVYSRVVTYVKWYNQNKPV